MSTFRTVAITSTTQYYLTVNNGGHGTAGGQGWYDSGTNAQATVTPLTDPIGSGSQYAFSIWTGDATGSASPSNNIMNGAKTATATWKTQYYITINSPHGSPLASQWVDQAGSLAVSVTSPAEIMSGDHQWICTGYNVDGGAAVSGTSYTFSNIQQTRSVTFNWKEQFYLTITSAYGSPTGQGWYDNSAAVVFSVTTRSQHDFASWSGTGAGAYTGSGATHAVTMNKLGNPIQSNLRGDWQYFTRGCSK